MWNMLLLDILDFQLIKSYFAIHSTFMYFIFDIGWANRISFYLFSNIREIFQYFLTVTPLSVTGLGSSVAPAESPFEGAAVGLNTGVVATLNKFKHM